MAAGGSFGGRIILIPGELDAPQQGVDEIVLPVPAFPLVVPQFIY